MDPQAFILSLYLPLSLSIAIIYIDGKFKAVVLQMTLDPSSYATMALREMLKIPTDSCFQVLFFSGMVGVCLRSIYRLYSLCFDITFHSIFCRVPAHAKG